ncbi:MAG: DUF1569 domain-containing protein [Ignavibacterium sp.]|nr:MAG: DUF1569 domain-containing protein [Ignavibacterium sp.]
MAIQFRSANVSNTDTSTIYIMFEQFIKQLNSLQSDQKPLWGKMTAQHMVEHLILALQMSNGKLNVKCISQPETLPPLKRFLLGDRPFPKEYINPFIGPDLLPLKFSDLNEARSELEKEINNYKNYFETRPDTETVHVTFGELNKQEWDQFHSKHFTHHLEQFNLI